MRVHGLVALLTLTAAAPLAEACDRELNFDAAPIWVDAVAIDTRELVPRRSLLDWAQRAHQGTLPHASENPEAVTRFRVMEYYRGSGEAVIEVEHRISHDGTSCSQDVRFEQGDRYFLFLLQRSDDSLYADVDFVAFGRSRDHILERLRPADRAASAADGGRVDGRE